MLHNKKITIFTSRMKLKKQKISVFFLLGLFFITLFNSVVPHTNHSHVTDISIAFIYKNTHKHSQYNDCHYNNKPQKNKLLKNSESSYIDPIEHSYDSHLHKLPPVTIEKTQKVQKGEFAMLFSNNFISFYETLKLKEKSNIVYKEKPYKNLFLLSTSLRGPPFLA